MDGYIIVYSTNIHNSEDFINLSNVLASFSPVLEWTIDLTDADKVLRVQTTQDITTLLIDGLKELGIRCTLMGTFIDKFCDD